VISGGGLQRRRAHAYPRRCPSPPTTPTRDADRRFRATAIKVIDAVVEAREGLAVG
jgi:hypothetical protein